MAACAELPDTKHGEPARPQSRHVAVVLDLAGPQDQPSAVLRQLTPLVKSLPEPPVAITKIPIVADLMGCLPVRHWVYFCVDDFSEWPGLDRTALGRMEELVIARADRLVTVSEVLQQRLTRLGRQANLLTHGVDFTFWQTNTGAEPLPGVTKWERPWIVFWGVIDRRMDTAFVRRLAEEMTEGTILLAGPEAEPDPALIGCRRVVRLGPVPFAQLPRLAREAAVLIMPYADLPVTRAMQPLKLKEYLATGRPAVVRDLPATRPGPIAWTWWPRRRRLRELCICASRPACRLLKRWPAND